MGKREEERETFRRCKETETLIIEEKKTLVRYLQQRCALYSAIFQLESLLHAS